MSCPSHRTKEMTVRSWRQEPLLLQLIWHRIMVLRLIWYWFWKIWNSYHWIMQDSFKIKGMTTTNTVALPLWSWLSSLSTAMIKKKKCPCKKTQLYQDHANVFIIIRLCKNVKMAKVPWSPVHWKGSLTKSRDQCIFIWKSLFEKQFFSRVPRRKFCEAKSVSKLMHSKIWRQCVLLSLALPCRRNIFLNNLPQCNMAWISNVWEVFSVLFRVIHGHPWSTSTLSMWAE